MTVQQTPHPFPIRLRDQTNHDLRTADITDSNARYIIRRMIADANAEGFNDGHQVGYWNTHDDNRDERGAKEQDA